MPWHSGMQQLHEGDLLHHFAAVGVSDGKILTELIISALKNGPLKKSDIYEAVKHAFPDVLTEEKQYKKLSNLLQKMKKEGVVDVRGSAVHAECFLVE